MTVCVLAPAVTAPADARTVKVQMPDVPLPTNVTGAYRCMWFLAPSDQKYHIYSVKLVSE